MQTSNQTLFRRTSFVVNFYNSFVIDSLTQKASNYEYEMAKLGGGCPPLSETIHIAMMWSEALATGPMGDA